MLGRECETGVEILVAPLFLSPTTTLYLTLCFLKTKVLLSLLHKSSLLLLLISVYSSQAETKILTFVFGPYSRILSTLKDHVLEEGFFIMIIYELILVNKLSSRMIQYNQL